ncbi:MAG: hypothetical protein AAGA69_01445 [Pseudomonadota bacterium]
MSFPLTALSRDVLRLRGPDTTSLLQGLLTANMDTLHDGPLFGALLTPQGKIVETMFLTPIGEDLYIDVSAGRGSAFARKLMLYRLRAKVEIEEVSISVGVAPDDSDVPEDVLTSAPDPRHPDLCIRFLTEGSGGLPETEQLYLIHQAALGVPDMHAGFGEAEVFPLDVNLDVLHGIDHKKGCFVGQEVASRMFRKGEIRKRTYIALGADVVPDTPLKQNDRTVGEIRHTQGDVALAMVRLDRLDDDSDSAEADGQTVTLIKPDYLP